MNGARERRTVNHFLLNEHKLQLVDQSEQSR
jgi:hypothetical protein